MSHPIKLVRLYSNENKTGTFILRAEPLPASVQARMTDKEHMARQDAERAAIHAEWKKINADHG